MTPNLFLATQKVLSPHKWFKTAPKQERATRRTEYWAQPVPGQYEYIPGRGWYLVATAKNEPIEDTTTKGGAVLSIEAVESLEFVKLAKPVSVHRSQILKRYLLEDEYKKRKSQGWIRNDAGRKVQVGFFRLDDGIAWVQCWDEEGEFVPRTEYKRWFLDTETGQFRHLRKSDDPNYIRSRNPSPTHKHDSDNRSQQSASTGFQRSGATSVKESAPSMPSTRASSIRGGVLSNPTSTPSSRAQSRRSSPRRNNSIPLEEAKAALRKMAEEQRAAVARAAARPRVERGRSALRLGEEA